MKNVATISARTLWLAAGIAILAVIVWVIGTRIVPELILMFSAIVIAEGARPPVVWLEARRVPRPLAILMILLGVILVLAGLAYVIISPLIAQVASLVGDIPHFADVAQHEIDNYQAFLRDNAQARSFLVQVPGRISIFLESKIGLVLQAPIALVGAISNLFLMILIAFFWLTASAELAAFVVGLFRPEHRAVARDVLDDFSLKTGGYVRGVLINMLVIGLLSFIGVFFLRVPYALLLGVVAALTEAIPIVGPLLGGSAAAIVALLADGPGKALEVAGLYLVIQQIEGNTLVPYVMNRAVALNPLAIVIALVIGSALLGIPGAVLAVPSAALIQVLVVRVIAPAIRRAPETA